MNKKNKTSTKRPKRRKVKVFCRLYKYVCASCNKNRHMRHSIVAGQICPRCISQLPPPDQNSLFDNPQSNGN